MQAHDVVVVGGGLAGLTSAAYLCRYGYRVLVCEKREKTGGLVETFHHQGFAFDAGIRAFENSGILFPMLKDLGIDMDFVQNPVTISIAGHRTVLDRTDGLARYAAMLTALFPDNAGDIVRIADEIRKVMGYMDVLYGIDNPLFLRDMPVSYLRKTLLPWLARYQVNIRKASRLNEPVGTYLQRLTPNGALIDMITQHFFRDTPTFFALSYFGQYLDYCYPLGGTGELAVRMHRHILDAGGEIRTGTAVRRVDARKRQVVLADGETIGYGKLVWAADQKALYATASGLGSPAEIRQRKRTEAARGGDSILTLFVGSDQPPAAYADRCGAHAFHTPRTSGLSSLPGWEAAAGKGPEALLAWVGIYLEHTTYEISCPVLQDPSLAPAGKTGLILSTRMDYRLVRRLADAGMYEAFKDLCTEKIVEMLGHSLFPGFRQDILFTRCATPLTIERETGNAEGAITGWAFTNAEMPAENRFRKILRSCRTPIPDVLQCGQWSFSPSGLPVSIVTGKVAADAVRKTLRPGRK